ncbi:hypothetical protein D1BOALGB6SA_10240 [Olavius sp. associated proteobacterium Delta 1]|nr:hypothetical protein D1BOALGB6SA_10240 [Olavius sp. associated proteobacterium Delta 1]
MLSNKFSLKNVGSGSQIEGGILNNIIILWHVTKAHVIKYGAEEFFKLGA